MNLHPYSMSLLAGIRHGELQDEAARIRLQREAQRDAPPMRADVSSAYRRLGAMLASARRLLLFARWTPVLSQRGAFTR